MTMAPPWPSQRSRGGLNSSERHSALARMKERRAGREVEDVQQKLPKPPLSARPPRSDRLDLPPATPGRPDTATSSGGSAKPWSPAWTPDSPRPRVDEADSRGSDRQGGAAGYETARERPTPRRPLVDEAAQQSQGREAFRGAQMNETWSAGRVRGPSEARSARQRGPAGPNDEDELPAQAKGADFRTLQEMIAKGIVESETLASKMEATPKAVDDSDEELRRHREAVRKRREEAEQAKVREREQARLKRQREWEDRSRKLKAELDEEEQDELRARESRKEDETQCQREHRAASRIQARVRGRRSRVGHPREVPRVRAPCHLEPYARSRPPSAELI